MDIHHAMMVRNRPERLYEALTRVEALSVWMAASAVIAPPGLAAVGSIIEFHYGQGSKPEHVQRLLRVEITGLEAGKLVRWQVIQPVWPLKHTDTKQAVTWTLTPFEKSTLVDLRMEGWDQAEEAYASVSYKWGSFMMRLKIYSGDLREIVDMLGVIEEKK